MADKKVNIIVDLDFTAERMSIDKIKDQMELAFKALKVNLDPASYKKAETQLKELHRIANMSLNKNTGKMNFKTMDTAITNSADIASIQLLSDTLTKAGVNGTKTFKEISNANQYLQKGLIESNSLLSKMGTTLANTIRWNLSASAINAVTGELQRAYGFAKDLDRSLTDIRIVSGHSAESMERFAVAANKSAKELKVSTIDYTNASLVFFQQGLKAIEVQNMTRAAIIGGNITGESTEEMSNLLTSVANGYKVATTDILSITDKLAAVGASTAADFYELATAMSKVASMARAAGVPIDDLNAQIATIVSVTKESPESIGMSLKTIYGRMLAFKADTKAIMTDEDGESFGAPNVEAALQAYSKATGAQISLFKITKDGKKELRELGDVINDIGGSWEKTSDNVAKFGLTTALAGSRQQNRLISLFDAWDEYTETVEVSLNAEGTSLKQNEIYLESYEGRLKGLQVAKEELYMTFMNTDGLKDFVSGLTTAVELISKISEVAGGLNAVLGIAGATLAKSGVLKAYTAMGSLKDLTASSGTGELGERLEITKQLNSVEKAFGAEKANMYRNNIKSATEEFALSKLKKDLLNEELTVLQNIKEIHNSDKSEAVKRASIKNLIEQNAHLDISAEKIRTVKKLHEDLTKERANLKLLQTEAGKGDPSEALLVSIRKSRVAIKEFSTELSNTDSDINARISKSSKIFKIKNEELQQTKKNLQDVAAESKKVQMATTGIQTAMMLLPSVIGAAKDSTNSWSDVLKSGLTMGTMLIPQILTGIMAIGPAFANAKAGASAFSIIMGTSLGPIGLAVMGVAALAAVVHMVVKNANELKDALVKVEEYTQNVDELESGYEGIKADLDHVISRMEEIGELTKDSSENVKKERDQLALKKADLENEIMIQEFLIEQEKEKLRLAGITALTAKEKSEYSREEPTTVTRGGETIEIQGAFKEVTIDEKLADTLKAYQNYVHRIKEYNNDLIELGKKPGGLKDPLNEGSANQLIFLLNQESEARIEVAAAMVKQLYEANELIAATEGATGEEKIRRDALIKSRDAILKTIEAERGNIDALVDRKEAEELALKTQADEAAAKEAAIKLTASLVEKYDEVTARLQTYGSFLNELNSKEGLSAKSKQDIISKHAELLPYLSDEQELRKQLIKIMAEEERVQKQAYANMLIDSEDFFIAKILGNAEVVNRLNEYYNADFDNFVSLADAKGKIEATLVEQLSGIWAEYYNAIAAGNTNTEAMLEDKVLKASRRGEEDTESVTQAKKVLEIIHKVGDVGNHFEKIALELGKVDFKGINLGDTKSGGSSKGDSPAYLESLDAEIRAIKIKNDHLVVSGDLLKEQLEAAKDIEGIEGLNEQYRITGEIIANNDLLLQSFKQEQDLIHKKAEQLRAQNSKYNTENWFDANAEQSVAYIELHRKGTKAQQEEMDILFGKIQTLKKAWMESNNEVKNIVDSSKELVATQDDLIKQQEELARVEYIKNHNDTYKKQQEALSHIAEIQERIVEIIRKRGEEERRILDENHRLEMESLEKRHNERKEGYAEELSDFQNLIQGKLDALDGQHAEEDYAENLRKERDKASELQKQIDVLSLDNSLDAKNKVATLRKQLSDQNESIAKMQQDRERTLLKESLEDQLTEFEENIAEKEEIADDWYENEVIKLEEDYKLSQIYHEKKYTDEKIYSEARQAILDGEVEVSKGRFVELSEAFEDFEDEFGKGMGILGDIIKDEFIDKLDKARKVIEEMKKDTFKLLEELDSDAKVPARDTRRDTSRDTGSSSSTNSNGIYMSSSDFNSYRGFKMMWEVAKKANDKDYMKAMSDGAQKIRDKYKINSDKYSYDELKNLTYKTARFNNGGKLTQTGTGVIDIHGSKSSPEWIFNDAQFKEILKSTVKSAMSFDLPKIPSFVNNGNSGNQYAITFDVRGNMDRSILPEVQRMINSTIETIEFQKVKDLNKIGQFRPVK